MPAKFEQWIERAQVFGEVAETYDRTRPGYPAVAVAWLVGRTPHRVLDLGAGTGKLTASLVSAGHDVVAVDPSRKMLAILQATVGDAAVRVGTAEAIPLPDASVGSVVVGQAFHWFDHAAAVPEIARVLRPNGRLALVWNLRDESVPWVAELSRVISSEDASAELMAPDLRAARTHFDGFETAQFRQTQRLDLNALLGLVRSRSYIAIRPEEEQDEVCAEVIGLFDRFAESGALTLPYVTHCHRATASASGRSRSFHDGIVG